MIIDSILGMYVAFWASVKYPSTISHVFQGSGERELAVDVRGIIIRVCDCKFFGTRTLIGTDDGFSSLGSIRSNGYTLQSLDTWHQPTMSAGHARDRPVTLTVLLEAMRVNRQFKHVVRLFRHPENSKIVTVPLNHLKEHKLLPTRVFEH